MGDAPRPNASTADGTQHPYRRHNNHHPLVQEEISIPYFRSYSPYTLASDLQTDYFSPPFHAAGPPDLPFSDSETDSQLHMDSLSLSQVEDKMEDFLMDHQVSFFTDLLEPHPDLSLGLALGLGQIDQDMGVLDCAPPEAGLELGLGLGMGMGSEEFRTAPSEFAGLPTQQPSFFQGLRVADVDSESDSDQILALHSHDFDHLPFCWDHYGFNQQQQNQIYDFGWQAEEEVEQVFDTTVGAQNGLYDWYSNAPQNAEADDHLHLDSDTDEDREIVDSFDETFEGLELEILVAVNNLSRDLDDETMFGVVEESMNEWRGNPPAAKSVIESLAVVHLSPDEIKENEITCAICWSEISAKEPLRQLPCRHYYHGDCIMSWLDIRNTCPICRFELPTDDLEYEYQRSEMDSQEGGEFLEDLPVTYENFHVFL